MECACGKLPEKLLVRLRKCAHRARSVLGRLAGIGRYPPPPLPEKPRLARLSEIIMRKILSANGLGVKILKTKTL
jgi:hypothetical protein